MAIKETMPFLLLIMLPVVMEASPVGMPQKPQEGITVTLDEFSGHSEPQWQILSTDAEYQEIEQLLGAARKSGFVYRTEEMPARLGFKGFVVEDTKKPRQEQLIVGPNTVKLQLLLLQTMPEGLVSSKIRQHIEEEVRSGKVTADVDGNRAKRWAPQYYPNLWNFDRLTNNCYNYASTKKTDTFAQPGRGSGKMYSRIIGPDVRDAAKRDGLLDFYMPPYRSPPAPQDPYWHLVALVVAPGLDFHWYRLDNNRYWSHKPGQTHVTDRDNSGNRIRDPRYADRGMYTDFVSFMYVNANTARIA